jgi:glycogen synthase
MSLPRVLMFGWEYPPHNSGGLGVACQGLAKALAEKNADITFVLPKRVSVSEDRFRIIFADVPNIKIKDVDSMLFPYVTSASYRSRLKELSLDNLYGTGLFEEVLRYGLLAGEIAKNEEFDVIHAHDWLSFLAGIEAKKVSGKPLVVHVHATEFDRTGNGNVNQNVYDIEKKGMEEADAVITVSQFTKDIVASRYGISPDKIHVVHNAIDIHSQRDEDVLKNPIIKLKESGNNIVLFLGRLTIQKGPDYFIRAAKKVLEHVPNTYFVIAGSGDMEYQIIKQASALGIGDKVIFAGFTRDRDNTILFHSANVYVLSSVSEPFGLVPLESLAHGTPAIISKQSGVSEVLSHTLKVDYWDIDEMANKIIAVLRSKALRNILIENGRKDVMKLSWQKVAQKCVNIYNKIIKLSILGK